MTSPIKMLHTEDPKESILRDVSSYVDNISLVLSNRILVCVYERPAMTAGKIFIPETADARKEDKFQGKVGLVLKMGPLAFTDDDTHVWGDNKPSIGDWVTFSVGDTKAFQFGKRTGRLVPENAVLMVINDPDVIY